MVAPRRYLLAGAPAALLFLLLARWVRSCDSLPFDLAVRAAIHAWASPLLTHAMLAVTALGSHLTMLPLGAVLVWRLAATGRRRQAILLAVASLAAQLVSHSLKLTLHRPRPEVFFGLAPAESFSFPSGHAFVGTVFYGLLASIRAASVRSRGKQVAIAAAAVLTAGSIGFSRVYLGYHYPSDVLGGWLCAAAWLALVRQFQAHQSEKAHNPLQ